MSQLLTPGLYRQAVEPIRAVGALARGDIAVLLGYADRGPVGVPVRVHSMRQLEEIFGPALDHGFLWHGAKGFFETGGRAAYVIRVAGDQATAARVVLAERTVSWRARASFPWARIDPKRLNRAGRLEAATWVQLYEELVRVEGQRSDDPGAWGNGLSVVVRRTARVRTEAVPGVYEDGYALRLASLAGVEQASVLELSQAGEATSLVRFVQPREVDAVRGLIRLAEVQQDFDSERPIRVTSVEFDVEVRRDGLLEESFFGLAPDPNHSIPLIGISARSVALTPAVMTKTGDTWADLSPAEMESTLAEMDWTDPSTWPVEGEFALAGGTDGLAEVGVAAYLTALGQVARLHDGAMIAAPDLVLPAQFMEPREPVPPDPPDCTALDPLPTGQIMGRVQGTTEAGETVPLSRVTVNAPGSGTQVKTDADGGFEITGLPLSFVTLRLNRDGYEPLEYRVQPTPFASTEPVEITMTPIAVPRSLGPDELAQVQAAMADPGIVGPYKVAMLDPPSSARRLDDLLTWRARLGDLPRAGFFAPWLSVGTPEGVVEVPPSGHICGAFAGAERAEGIQRSGANQRLRHAEGVRLAIDDAEQASLNPVGVNAIRAFPGRGIRLHGTRTLGADPAARYLTTRRILDAIEKSLERALHWMVFEPNNLMTRQAVDMSARSFLDQVWRDGVLAGLSPEAAFTVKCDSDNNPADTREVGQMVVDIGVAPAEPYEFVLLRLGAQFDAVRVTERGS